jgi:quinoprotein glucose dehydrogenase
MKKLLFLIPILLLVLIAVVYFQNTRDVNNDSGWLQYGKDYSHSKFSDLDNIHINNVSKLKEVWHFEEVREGSSIFFNPLVINGKMIALMPSKRIVCLDAANGNFLWEFTPDESQIANWTKGITFSPGTKERPGAVFFVFGATLYALNISNGKLITTFGEGGKVDFYNGLEIDSSLRDRVPVTSNAPGVIFNDLLIIGCKVPDELPSISGDIRAFNINTGKLEWIFNTIPKEGEFGSETWPENARQRNGGANCWGGMALDQKRGVVYIPTGSPTFDFYGADRPGQNLFANSLIALDAKTGKYIWHFQTTHHDLWDRDNGSPPNLVTVEHNGKKIDGVALVTKMGFTFLFDRDTGEPLFPIEEVPVPTDSEMPGEIPWPTQPIPTKPKPFARQGFKKEYFSTITPEMIKFIDDTLASEKFQTGIYNPPNLTGSIVVPAAHGGANWGGAAYNPNSNVIFVNSTDLPWYLALKEIDSFKKRDSLNGKALYKMYCSSCHGTDMKGTGIGPDISSRIDAYSPENLRSLIVNGAEPMPSFKHLPDIQINAIVSYLKEIDFNHIQETTSGPEEEEPYTFSGYDFFNDKDGIPIIKPPYSTLTAIDLNSGEHLWQVPLGEDQRLVKMGIRNSGTYNRGGCIATAGGLIFIGATMDKKFRAFNQANGEIVWEYDLPGNATAIPSTYEVDGKQYVTIAVSPNSSIGYKGGYLTFTID